MRIFSPCKVGAPSGATPHPEKLRYLSLFEMIMSMSKAIRSNIDPEGKELATAALSAALNITFQFVINYEANGHDVGQEFKCINANSVLSAFVVGAFFPGLGATAGISFKALTGLLGGATGAEVASTATGFALGPAESYVMTTTLNEQNGPDVAEPCGCNKSNSGIGAALHNFLY
jgi:hypothetical protein